MVNSSSQSDTDFFKWICGENKPVPSELKKRDSLLGDLFEDETNDCEGFVGPIQPLSNPKPHKNLQARSEEVIKVSSQEGLEEAIIAAGGYLDTTGCTQCVDKVVEKKASEAIALLTKTAVAIQEEGISDIFNEKTGQTTLKFIESVDHLETILPLEDGEEDDSGE